MKYSTKKTILLITVILACFSVDAQEVVTSLTIKNDAYVDANNTPISIGHMFKPCDLTTGIAVYDNGTEIPTQVDVKTTHENGSAAHAIISFVLPFIEKRSSKTLTLQKVTSVDTTKKFSVADILATNFDAKATFTKHGETYTISARTLLSNDTTPEMWLDGNVAREFLLSGIPETTMGEPDSALNVQFHVRFFDLDRVWVSVVAENVWALNRKNITYDVQVELGDTNATTVLNESGLTHYYDSRWRRVFWWGEQAADLEIHFNLPYFIETGAVPRYDTTVNINYFVGNYGDTSLMGNAGITQYFPSTGGREDIGLYPAWAARYMLSFDKMYERQTYLIGQQSGSIPVHLKDKTTNKLWSIEDHPTSSTLPAVQSQQNANDELPVSQGWTPWTPDYAHQPSLVYIPYLFTGEKYFLDELHYWANWNMVSQNFLTRGYSQGIHDVLQVRSKAWTVRTLADAVFISPDDTWEKFYFQDKLNNTLASFQVNIMESHKPISGWHGGNSTSVYSDACMSVATDWFTAPWETDFLIVSLNHLLDLGFEEARPTRDWLAEFSIGRFTNHPDYNKYDGAPFRIAVIDTLGNHFTSWSELHQNTFAECLTNRPTSLSSSDCVHGYEYIARAALSGAYRDTITKSDEAFLFLDSNLTGACWSSYPTWAFIPGAHIIRNTEPCPPDTVTNIGEPLPTDTGITTLEAENIARELFSFETEEILQDSTPSPTIEDSTDTENLQLLEVWPSVFSDELNIRLNNVTAFPVDVTITNVMGKEMDAIRFWKSNVIEQWSPRNMANGIYIVNLTVNNISETIKVICSENLE